MGLIDSITKTLLGYGGVKPNFKGETPTSTLHNRSSTLGNPPIIRNPSLLDEEDSLNTSKYKSQKGKKYLDQSFR